MALSEPPIEIALLIYPQVQLAAVYGLTDLFGFADQFARDRMASEQPCFRISHWNIEPAGTDLTRVYESIPGGQAVPNVVIIPPSLKVPPTACDFACLLTWLRGCHEQGSTLASVCAGAFILAETGLLAGRQATTHWTCATELAEQFPSINVDAGRILIDEGDIVTAGGIMAWTDLGLRLVDRLLGPAVMMDTAKFLLIDPPGREQRHYSAFSPPMNHGDTSILKTQRRLQTETVRELATTDMAAWAGLEVRTFLRRFQKATGLKPIEYWQHVRIERARHLLEKTLEPVEKVAWDVGYEDAGSFRKVFIKITGLTPVEYRKRFGSFQLQAAS